MQKFGTKSLLLIALSIFATQVSAVNIQDFKVTPDGRQYLEFSWEKLANSDIDQETHYGLQWSDGQSDIRIDKPTSARISTSQNVFRMRGDMVFEKDKTYYARIYGFYRGDMQRKNYLTKGSKILQFKWLSNGNIETSEIEPNDPTIVADNATTTAAKEFGKLIASPYDTSVQLSWSTTNDVFDNYVFVLSHASDLSDPVAEFKIDKTYKKALITGLDLEKKYFVAGYLSRNDRKFGKGETVNFTTLTKFNSDKQRRFDKYILAKKRYGKLLSIGEDVATDTEEVTTTSTDTSSITARIAELKKLIAKYQAELRKLEAQNPAKKRTLRSRSSRTSLSSRLRNWRSRR